jgi:hypothetical protein
MRFHLTIMKPPGAGFYVQAFHEVVETIDLAKRYTIWDYSPANMAYWHEHGIEADYVPVGYVPQLTRIVPAIHPDIDVLWYGALNGRRARVLQELQQMPGLKTVILLTYGKERDEHIARSKVVLNMHYYDSPQLFEIVRVSYLLANHKCVVSEKSEDFPLYLIDGLRNAKYDGLADACRDLVEDIERRLQYQEQGFQKFSRMRETDILRTTISHLAPRPPCPADGAAASAS